MSDFFSLTPQATGWQPAPPVNNNTFMHRVWGVVGAMIQGPQSNGQMIPPNYQKALFATIDMRNPECRKNLEGLQQHVYQGLVNMGIDPRDPNGIDPNAIAQAASSWVAWAIDMINSKRMQAAAAQQQNAMMSGGMMGGGFNPGYAPNAGFSSNNIYEQQPTATQTVGADSTSLYEDSNDRIAPTAPVAAKPIILPTAPAPQAPATGSVENGSVYATHLVGAPKHMLKDDMLYHVLRDREITLNEFSTVTLDNNKSYNLIKLRVHYCINENDALEQVQRAFPDSILGAPYMMAINKDVVEAIRCPQEETIRVFKSISEEAERNPSNIAYRLGDLLDGMDLQRSHHQAIEEFLVRKINQQLFRSLRVEELHRFVSINNLAGLLMLLRGEFKGPLSTSAKRNDVVIEVCTMVLNQYVVDPNTDNGCVIDLTTNTEVLEFIRLCPDISVSYDGNSKYSLGDDDEQNLDWCKKLAGQYTLLQYHNTCFVSNILSKESLESPDIAYRNHSADDAPFWTCFSRLDPSVYDDYNVYNKNGKRGFLYRQLVKTIDTEDDKPAYHLVGGQYLYRYYDDTTATVPQSMAF